MSRSSMGRRPHHITWVGRFVEDWARPVSARRAKRAARKRERQAAARAIRLERTTS